MSDKDFDCALRAAWKAGYEFCLNEESVFIDEEVMPELIREETLDMITDDDEQLDWQARRAVETRQIITDMDIARITCEFLV